MRFAVVSLFPEMFDAITAYGVTGRAVREEQVSVKVFNPRQYTEDKHQTVDDRPYGGGPGMLMCCEPLQKAIHAAKQWLAEQRDANGELQRDARVVYLSPQGKLLSQAGVDRFAQQSDLDWVLLAGRYEGIDERLIALEVDEEWSIGDYVVSGGELPAMILMDAVIRRLPGVLGHAESAEQDSFCQGVLDFPQYTRPEEFGGLKVPSVLLSGDHEKIRLWRNQQAQQRTNERRPDLVKASLTNETR